MRSPGTTRATRLFAPAGGGFVPDEGCSIRGLRIGFPENFFFERLDAEVESAVRGAIARARSLGAVIKPVRVPDIDGLNAVARVILLAEAAAVMEPYLERPRQLRRGRSGAVGPGPSVPATDYINAQRLRRKMRRNSPRLEGSRLPGQLRRHPHLRRASETPVRLGGRDEDVVSPHAAARGINVLGFRLSFPCGLTRPGLPVGTADHRAGFRRGDCCVGAALEDAGVGIPP